jgi:hypothetical protein
MAAGSRVDGGRGVAVGSGVAVANGTFAVAVDVSVGGCLGVEDGVDGAELRQVISSNTPISSAQTIQRTVRRKDASFICQYRAHYTIFHAAPTCATIEEMEIEIWTLAI